MATLRTTCPGCTLGIDLEPGEVLATQAEDGTGTYSFVCPSCRDLTTKAADRRALGLLLLAGIEPLAVARPVHPEAPPAGPALTRDDLLDLHFLLEDDRRFLASITPTRTT